VNKSIYKIQTEEIAIFEEELEKLEKSKKNLKKR